MNHFLGLSLKSPVGDRTNVQHLEAQKPSPLSPASFAFSFVVLGIAPSSFAQVSGPQNERPHPRRPGRPAAADWRRGQGAFTRGRVAHCPLATCFLLVLQPRMAVRLGSCHRKPTCAVKRCFAWILEQSIYTEKHGEVK